MHSARTAELWSGIAEGRTDYVFDLVGEGGAADERDGNGISLMRHCAYYGDVSAMRFLMDRGAGLEGRGENLDLNAAAFHGHWRLCSFLLERGAEVNWADGETGETALHSALAKTDRMAYDLVLKVLLEHGAEVNCATIPGVATGGFMRDVRTRGETPLHRAAAFGEEETIALLLDAGAAVEARDVNGDSPLTWASWYLRPAGILRMLCFGEHRVRVGNKAMRANLLGKPTTVSDK